MVGGLSAIMGGDLEEISEFQLESEQETLILKEAKNERTKVIRF